ncbi:MAG: cardiolipin synthase B, partial [Comamonadaceae bacterium]
MWIFASVLLALVVAMLYLNLSSGEKRVTQEIPHLYPVDDPQFFRALGMLLGPDIVEGNQARALMNGREIFPAMLEAIRGAQKTVLFETFLYWSG